MRRTRSLGGQPRRDLLRLAPDGVWLAAVSPRRWWALTPPFHPYLRRLRRVSIAEGGLLSVPLSVGFRRLGFPQRPALWCPDFPRAAETARGHPACTPDCSPASARLTPARRLAPHSGHAIAAPVWSTNSPQTRHSRLTPRKSASSSWSSVR